MEWKRKSQYQSCYLHANIYGQVSCSNRAAVKGFGLKVGNGNTREPVTKSTFVLAKSAVIQWPSRLSDGLRWLSQSVCNILALHPRQSWQMSSNFVLVLFLGFLFIYFAMVCAVHWRWSQRWTHAGYGLLRSQQKCGSSCPSQWGSKPEHQLWSSALRSSQPVHLLRDIWWLRPFFCLIFQLLNHSESLKLLSPWQNLDLFGYLAHLLAVLERPLSKDASYRRKRFSFQRGPISLTCKDSRSSAQERSHGNGFTCKLRGSPRSDPASAGWDPHRSRRGWITTKTKQVYYRNRSSNIVMLYNSHQVLENWLFFYDVLQSRVTWLLLCFDNE